MSNQTPPDLKDLVEHDEYVGRTGNPGWYLEPESNGTRERYWDGMRWTTKVRNSGPLRRWFRGLPADKQAKVLAALFFGVMIALIVLTGNTAPEGCQYGGGRFDHSC
jgi:hypothetical protein